MNDNFELSPELLEAIAPSVDPKKAQIKFDAAGTLHVLERGDDGSLRNDYALKHVEEKIREDTKRTKIEQLNEKKADNRNSRAYYTLLLISVIILMLSIVYVTYTQITTDVGTIITCGILIICSMLCICFSLWHLVKSTL